MKSVGLHPRPDVNFPHIAPENPVNRTPPRSPDHHGRRRLRSPRRQS